MHYINPNLEKLLPSIRGAQVLSIKKTRLGGDIIHCIMDNQLEAFVKVGTGFERLEIIREYNNITSLKECLPIPKVYGFAKTLNYSAIILQKMPGAPLHTMVPSLGRQTSLILIKDIFDKILNVNSDIKKSFEIGILQELEDIKILLENKQINEENFIKLSEGLSTEKAFEKIHSNLANHITNTLTHGDFCLPNIMVTPDKGWCLIDLGKCGLGDPCRDLSALEGSLKRNIDDEAFSELCKIMHINITLDLQQKIDTYKLLDFFWYNIIV